MRISLPYSPFEHVWPSLFTGLEKFRNLSINLRCGSTSMFLSSSLFLSWPKPPPPKPPSISGLLCPLAFCAGNSTQAGLLVIYLPVLYIAVTFQTTPVILSTPLPGTSYYMSALIPAPAFGFYPQCLHQNFGLLLRPFHIYAQSNQCGEFMSPLLIPFSQQSQTAPAQTATNL